MLSTLCCMFYQYGLECQYDLWFSFNTTSRANVALPSGFAAQPMRLMISSDR